jgi:glucose/arabinose dehydrogenase
LNHGIALSSDGKTLYASTSDVVYSWAYDAATGSVGSTNRTLVSNMTNSDHTTRTLLLSKKAPGILLVSRGSDSNEDSSARDITSGHSQLRGFDLGALHDGSPPYDFSTAGTLLGWGLRNSVGIAEHPTTGGIYSVENSVDELQRNGVDIHQDNPGEEMNFHGYLHGSMMDRGGNYGYPDCYALWSTKNFPSLGSLKTGDQFAVTQSDGLNDTTCAETYIAPRLTFQAHMAPLDIKFTPDGLTALVTFHGSCEFPHALQCRVPLNHNRIHL